MRKRSRTSVTAKLGMPHCRRCNDSSSAAINLRTAPIVSVVRVGPHALGALPGKKGVQWLNPFHRCGNIDTG